MKYKYFYFCYFIACLLVLSFMYSPTHFLWEKFDVYSFKFLNDFLRGPYWVQIFWALANHKKADIVEDFVFLGFFILGIIAAPSKEKLHRIAQLLFCILVIGGIIYFANMRLFRKNLHLFRKSPSLVVTPCVRLSQNLPQLTIKDETLSSFPGDHATCLIAFAFLYTYFVGIKLGKYAYLYSLFRCLPRLVVGAHWVSDILVGSLGVALFCLSWVICTPLQGWLIHHIEKILRTVKHRYQKNVQRYLS